MKLLFGLFCLSLATTINAGNAGGRVRAGDTTATACDPTATACTQKECIENGHAYDDYLTDLLNQQIDLELTAQYSYLRLAHLFQQPYLYYPKFADFFREKSMEEMEHAEDFMNYQTQRGVQRSETFKFTTTTDQIPEACTDIDSLYDGFKCAQDLEISVTKALTQLVSNVGNIKYNNARSTDCINDPDTTKDECAILYNKELRKAQAALVKYVDGSDSWTKSLMAVAESNNSSQIQCNSLTFDYIELAEHISHEYLGHQIKDTKVLANAVGTLARCAKKHGTYDGDNAFHETCVFAVERLLKLE